MGTRVTSNRVLDEAVRRKSMPRDDLSQTLQIKAAHRTLHRALAKERITVSDLQKMIKEQSVGIQSQQRVIELLRNELWSVLRSRSWQFTGPLRWLTQSGPVHKYDVNEATEFVDALCALARDDSANGDSPNDDSNSSSEPSQHRPLDARSRSVLFIVSGHDPMTVAYRGGAVAERLSASGWIVETVSMDSLPTAADYSAVVMCRTPLTAELEAFVLWCRDAGSVLLYDVDDLLFREDAFTEIEALTRRHPADRTTAIDGFLRCRDAALLADYWTVSTIQLANELSCFGKPISVIPNAMPVYGPQSPSIRGFTRGPILRIGYFSGSKTHQNDFLPLREALNDVLSSRADVELVLAGHIDAQFSPRAEQHVKRHAFGSHEKALQLLSEVDLVLAPLAQTRFNACKSELKIFEPAFFGIPAMATTNATTERSIISGWNGWLVDQSTDSWHSALERCLEDPGVLVEVGANASRTIAIRHSAASVSRLWIDLLVEICCLRGV